MTHMRAWLIGGAVLLAFMLPVAIVGRDQLGHDLYVALTWLGILVPASVIFAIEHGDELFRRRDR